MSSKKIKRTIIESKGYFCEMCMLSEWKGSAICLELDHIDGNNKNNNITNLRLLCPNCHSQTSTFRGRNIKNRKNVPDDVLMQALFETGNIRQALIKVGLTPKSDNYRRASALLNRGYMKGSHTKNSQFDTHWINNGIINKKIKKAVLDEHLSVGWSLGRIVTRKPPSIKGRFWVTNGMINRMVNEIPEGFWRGKIQR